MVREANSTRHGGGVETKLIKLKNTCGFPYLHGMLFPGQSIVPNTRAHIIKMSTTGPGSGVELVNRMRRDGVGDLCHSWVCFDHVRRVVGWTTMAAHVYDPS